MQNSVIGRRFALAIPAAIAILVAIGAAAGQNARGAAAGTAAAPAPTARAPLASGPAADLDIVFTAQALGWIEPCG